MITVKNYETLIRLPSTPKEEEYAVCTDDRSVYKYTENAWHKVDSSDAKLNISLYELNKTVYMSIPELTFNELQESKRKIDKWVKNTKNLYFMLLNRERSDYTIFNLSTNIYLNSISKEIIDIVCSRGRVKSIEISDEFFEQYIQFWVEDNKEIYMYALFPCDSVVIECTR